MNRLRHPIRAIREPFGTAGLIVACVALIAALAGGAYAAAGLTGKQKKEVKAIAKKFAGKPGADGATGPAGPVGPAGAKGDTGAAGANGKDGTNGTNGKDGTNGVSPVGTAFSGEQNGCKEGGVKFVGANTTVACNGVKGAAGQDGKDGKTGFTETLPSGETETGVWALGAKAQGQTFYPLSFNIPLETPPTDIRFVAASGLEFERSFNPITEEFEIKYVTPVNCLGSPEEPTAPSGIVCIYAKKEVIADKEVEGFREVPPFEDFFTAGVVFFVNLNPGGQFFGTWAVTAE